MKRSKTHDLVLSALGTAFIAVCSWITVPSTVPFTLQTFAVYSVLCLFGAKTGIWAIVAYIALGAFGVPVFSNFTGGLGALFGSTGGYIFGFLFVGVSYALFSRFVNENPLTQVLALIVGTLFCYAFGTVWFTVLYTNANGAIGISTALLWCVVPFLLPDAIKLVLAVLLAKKLKPFLSEKS